MQVNRDGLRQHYRSLSDEELSALRREELIELAQECYDEERQRRGLVDTDESDIGEGFAGYQGDVADGKVEPGWLQTAVYAASFLSHPGGSAAFDVADVRLALQRAGIPCQLARVEVTPPDGDQLPQHEYRAMIPASLTLEANSILDKEIFNPQIEAEWRRLLESLTDEELAGLDPDVLCAGLFDRIGRLKRSYNDEVSRRMRRSSSEP